MFSRLLVLCLVMKGEFIFKLLKIITPLEWMYYNLFPPFYVPRDLRFNRIREIPGSVFKKLKNLNTL